MPTYEFACPCGHKEDRFEPWTDDPKRTCPECLERTLVRQLGSGGGIIFKGTGFYQTDYKGGGEKK